MGMERNKAVIPLKIIREVVAGFDRFIVDLAKKEEEYGVSTRDTTNMNLGNKEYLQVLKEVLGLEKLGLLLLFIGDVSAIQNDFSNFMKFNTAEKLQFHEKLAKVIENLDKALEGL